MQQRKSERAARPDYLRVSMEDILVTPRTPETEEYLCDIFQMLKDLRFIEIGGVIPDALVFSIRGREGEPNKIEVYYEDVLVRECFLTRKPWQIECYFEEHQWVPLTFENIKDLNAAFNFFLYQWGFYDDE